MNHTIPGVAGIVDDDVNFAIAEVGGLFDETLNVRLVCDVSRDGDSLATVGVDLFRNVC